MIISNNKFESLNSHWILICFVTSLLRFSLCRCDRYLHHPLSTCRANCLINYERVTCVSCIESLSYFTDPLSGLPCHARVGVQGWPGSDERLCLWQQEGWCAGASSIEDQESQICHWGRHYHSTHWWHDQDVSGGEKTSVRRDGMNLLGIWLAVCRHILWTMLQKCFLKVLRWSNSFAYTYCGLLFVPKWTAVIVVPCVLLFSVWL